MKQLLKKVFLFLLPIILLAYPLDWFISNGLRKSYENVGNFEICNDLYSGDINTDILVLGSSRALYHVDPDILEQETNMSAYVLAFDGSRFNIQYELLQEYLRYNDKPKTIILSLDNLSIRSPSEVDKKSFLPFMLFNSEMQQSIGKWLNYSKYDYYIPMLRYIGDFSALKFSIRHYLIPQKERYRRKGYVPVYYHWYTLSHGKVPYDKSVNDKRDIWEDDYENHLLYKDLFTQFIEECKAAGIELVLVYSPEYKDRDHVVATVVQANEYYEKVSREYDVPFFNYADDPMVSDTAYFYNVLHLNVEGSRKFSRELGIELQQLKLN